MTPFFRHATFLFLALRAGDVVNLAAGLWLVPKFVASEDLGAVLPVTTFATLLALPAFAFGMAVMKESADLAGRQAHGQLKTLWRGVFLAIGLLTVLSLVLSALLLPHYLGRMRIRDSAVGFFVLAAALLGAVAPVYTDALQAVKRFRALGAIELASAVVRFAALTLLMPIRALAGYFAGNALQPLVRIAASLFALRSDLAVRAERWWTRENTRRLGVRFGLILVYLAVPMIVASTEQDLIREHLPTTDSAAYYVITRLSDLMNYITFPLLIVLFPYAAEATRNGRSPFPLVIKTSAVICAAALLLGIVYAIGGASILTLMPNGSSYAAYLPHLPMLLAIQALTACQTLYTNAEVASGRFRFLRWFIPAHLAYFFLLVVENDPRVTSQGTTLDTLIGCFGLGALLRFVCAAVDGFCRERRFRRAT